MIKIAAATDMLRNIKPVLPDQPPIRSTFDIYHSADLLIYHKEPCRAEDVQEPFFLHIYPAETGDLPPHRRQHGFDNLDFAFPDYSFRCTRAASPCARYPITPSSASAPASTCKWQTVTTTSGRRSSPLRPKKRMAAPGDAGIVDTLELRGEQVSVEPIYGGGRLNVLLIANPNEIKESGVATAHSDYEALVSGEPVIRATFDIYLSENTLA